MSGWIGIFHVFFNTLLGAYLIYLVAFAVYETHRRRAARPYLNCRACRYNLTAHVRLESGRVQFVDDERTVCPECGTDLKADYAIAWPHATDDAGLLRDRRFVDVVSLVVLTLYLVNRNLKDMEWAARFQGAPAGPPLLAWKDWILPGVTAFVTLLSLVKFIRERPTSRRIR